MSLTDKEAKILSVLNSSKFAYARYVPAGTYFDAYYRFYMRDDTSPTGVTGAQNPGGCSVTEYEKLKGTNSDYLSPTEKF